MNPKRLKVTYAATKPKTLAWKLSVHGAKPKGPRDGIVYTLGAQIPTIMVIGPFGQKNGLEVVGAWRGCHFGLAGLHEKAGPTHGGFVCLFLLLLLLLFLFSLSLSRAFRLKATRPRLSSARAH